MITVLTITDKTPENRLQKALMTFMPSPVKAEILTVAGITVVNILCVSCNGSVPFKKLAKILGVQKRNIVCSEDIALPQELGFKRYVPQALYMRLAENAAVSYLMKEQGSEKNVGLYDLTGRHCDSLSFLLPYCKNIYVVTENLSLYMELSAKLLEEYGAPITITKNPGKLYDCDVVIAPQKIKKALPLKTGARLYTGFAPAVNQSGVVYKSFKTVLPEIYQKLKPEGIDSTYFAAVLYEAERQFSLGSLVPEE